MRWVLKLVVCVTLSVPLQADPQFQRVIASECWQDSISGKIPEFIVTADRQNWLVMVDKVLNTGEYSPENWPLPETYYLKHQYPDDTSPHKVDYVNIWGQSDQGAFISSYVTIVSEDWAINEKNQWVIDQWMFKFEMDGSIITATHKTIIEKRDRTVISITTHPLDLGDPCVRLKCDVLIQMWIGY